MEKISIHQFADFSVESIKQRMPFVLTYGDETFAVVMAPGDYETANKLVFETKFDIQRHG